MISASNFETYVKENRLNASLFFYVHMIDAAGNQYYFTDAKTQLSNYLPAKLDVSPAFYEASLFSGLYSVRPVRVEISNIPQLQASRTALSERFTKYFYNNEFETEICHIYLGYSGIASTSDLFPYYSGRMSNFEADIIGVRFDLVNQFIFELPLIPKNKFTRSAFAKINEEFIGKPIPIVYGRWNYQPSGGTHYGDKSFIPMYLTENNIDQSTPQLVLECANHEVDAIDGVYIYDDTLQTIGEIQDDITLSLANARATIDLNTADVRDFMRAIYHLYANRVVETSGTVTNENNAIDSDYDTLASVANGAVLTVGLPAVGAFSAEDLTPLFYDSTGEQTVSIAAALIEVSCYPADTWDSGEVLTVGIGDSAGNIWFSQNFDYTAVNALSDSDSFNLACDNLVLVDNHEWTGSENAFILREDSGSPVSYNIQPEAGYYTTMQDLAVEIDRKIAESSAANAYSFTYVKSFNKFLLKRISGAVDFIMVDSGRASTLGIDGLGGYSTTQIYGDRSTVIEVPDGDFSQLRIYVYNNSTDETIYVKGVRVKITKTFRDYNIASVSGRRPGRRSPVPLPPRRGTVVGGGGPRDTKVITTDLAKKLSIREQLAGSQFFATVDGLPDDASSYYKTGPEIIKSLITDHIGLASSTIDTTSFTAATTNAATELALYLDAETDPVSVFANLARYSKGFIHIGQNGKYKCNTLQSSYTAADVDFTIYYRDVKAPMRENLKITRNNIGEISKDLYFYYLLNWANDDWNANLQKTTNSTLNIPATQEFCQYVTDDDQAVILAEYLSGNGDTLGQFGSLRRIVRLEMLAAEYHLVELGDIAQFSTDWDTVSDVYGVNFSSLFFMVVGKQYHRKNVMLYLLEIATVTEEITEDADYTDTLDML